MNRGGLLALLALATLTSTFVAVRSPPRAVESPVDLALPGTDEHTLPGELRNHLATRAQQRAARGQPPRTRHLDDAGRPLYTNRLVASASPYLQQHAHNPVNWFEWGDEAFELARTLNRPVFLSVGYATCHWCHVMEEESFEDPEIAAFLNAHFIAIKVDRETRPDIDRIYMTAVTAMRGSGGWPMSVWTQPDGEPFFAATYLPARDGDRGTRSGFLTVLRNIAHTWEVSPAQIEATAARLTEHVRQSLAPPPDSGVPGPEVFEALLEWAADRYDPEHGGPRGRPKFPSNLPVRALLAAAFSGDEDARTAALHTLDRMAAGGIYDQVGGGFHRYSVDASWRVPHFEKMLYDNAQLARLYGEAFQLSDDLRYAMVAEETLTFLQRDLGAREGGFASALDADSLTPGGHREEGWYYTWTPDELRIALGDRAAAFMKTYGISGKGNFEGRNIPFFYPIPDLQTRRAHDRDRLELELVRRRRPAPLRDEKVLTSWNGLAIDAFAYNGWLFAREDWLDEARSTAALLLEGREHGRLRRMLGEQGWEGTAFLEDYAFLIKGLLALFEATGEGRWLSEAIALEARAREDFGDGDGAWFRTPHDHEALLVREKPAHDQAIPSGNTVMLDNLLRLHAITTDDRYRQAADAIASGLDISSMPGAFPTAVLALRGRHDPLDELVLVGPPTSAMKAALRRVHPSRYVRIHRGDPALDALVPGLADKVQLEGTTAYVCRGGVCDRPTTDPERLLELLTR